MTVTHGLIDLSTLTLAADADHVWAPTAPPAGGATELGRAAAVSWGSAQVVISGEPYGDWSVQDALAELVGLLDVGAPLAGAERRAHLVRVVAQARRVLGAAHELLDEIDSALGDLLGDLVVDGDGCQERPAHVRTEAVGRLAAAGFTLDGAMR